MGKKNNNMLIYGAIALIAIVYILYRILYAKEGFATTETPMTCGEFCPNGYCANFGMRVIGCYNLYYAQKDLGTGEFKCNVNGFKGALYPHAISSTNVTPIAGRLNTTQDIPVCLGIKMHDPLGEASNDHFLINTSREYESSCDPRLGEIPVISVDENGERPFSIVPTSYINNLGEEVPSLDENAGRRRPNTSATCVRLKTVVKSKDRSKIPDFECKGPAGSQSIILPNTSARDRDSAKKICMTVRRDTGEPFPYFLD
jgi:hypothetical protein